MKRDRKAQMHMTETVAVLFIFLVLVVFGIIFYYQYQKGSLEEKQDELLGKRAIETTTQVLFLPELACSLEEAASIKDCFDLMKLRSIAESDLFNENMENYYFNLFSYATIKVKQLYPEPREIILYEKEKTETLEDGTVVPGWENKKSTFFVITLRDEAASSPGEPQFNFGYVEVTVYS